MGGGAAWTVVVFDFFCLVEVEEISVEISAEASHHTTPCLFYRLLVKNPPPLKPPPTAMATTVPQDNPACPSSFPSSFPNKGVSLDFLCLKTRIVNTLKVLRTLLPQCPSHKRGR